MEEESRGFLFAILLALIYVLVWFKHYQSMTTYLESLDSKSLNGFGLLFKLWAFQATVLVYVIIFFFVMWILHVFVFRQLEVASSVHGFIKHIAASLVIAFFVTTILVYFTLIIYRHAIKDNEKPKGVTLKNLLHWIRYYFRVVFLPNVDSINSKKQTVLTLTFLNLMVFFTYVVSFQTLGQELVQLEIPILISGHALSSASDPNQKL